ncbi:hypothetical protein OGAPHI_003023 [Ogataea philodendri]|uniref:Uncharacterized protein n=1 Tax=Ogataea philodendri TaxID=1378263 RepID=A0A9P8P9G7_9ASCO|nr:uncharacterized protein OGAPHI_003023 [Ogataea philodendri]KAH3667374.1 hypothetical protein OGAPHI_003023 [Ogataea philodendri]
MVLTRSNLGSKNPILLSCCFTSWVTCFLMLLSFVRSLSRSSSSESALSESSLLRMVEMASSLASSTLLGNMPSTKKADVPGAVCWVNCLVSLRLTGSSEASSEPWCLNQDVTVDVRRLNPLECAGTWSPDLMLASAVGGGTEATELSRDFLPGWYDRTELVSWIGSDAIDADDSDEIDASSIWDSRNGSITNKIRK